MKIATNLAPRKYDDEGFPYWESQLSPTSNATRALVLAPPDQVIPVIFVPGIMGSNLKITNALSKDGKAAGDVAWRPDGAGYSDTKRDADARQRILDPLNTQVDTRVTIDGKTFLSLSGMSIPLKAAEARGWGSVFWGSYGDFLLWLDANLNLPCFYDADSEKVLISALFQPLIDDGIAIPGKSPLKLNRSEIEHMSEYWLPVHAVGYNWLQSNKDAGKYLSSEIRRIKKLYQTRLKRPDACQKVILVTHSMGGLVARAAVHPEMGNAGDDVLGILHGVMPAIGAAAAYKRMRTGFELGEVDWGSFSSIKAAWGGQQVAGGNGRDVTAVLGHSPGGLQLLPNKQYHPEGWLKATDTNSTPYTVPMAGDPYKSIYREKNKWWRLITPEWLDPARKYKENSPNTAWGSYGKALQESENFHDTLKNYYHHHTYTFHGADTKRFRAFGTVTWKKASFMNRDIRETFNKETTNSTLMREGLAHLPWDSSKGYTVATLNGAYQSFEMTDPIDAGDGTVPMSSGGSSHTSAPLCVHTQVGFTNVDHQGAYSTNRTQVMQYVLYSACQIANKTL